MIGARLTVSFGKDNMPLAEFQVALLFELVKLPLNEGIVEGIGIGGDKGAAPVCENAEILQVLLALGREESSPIVRVLKLGDLCVRYLKGLQNLKLSRLILRALSSGSVGFDFAF